MPRPDKVGRVRWTRRADLMDRRSHHPVGLHGGPPPNPPLIGTMDREEMDRRVARAQRRGRLLAEATRIRRQLAVLERRIEANGNRR